MPNSRHSEAIVSPSLSRITNRIRSSITELSFHGILLSAPFGPKSVTHVSGTFCYLCLGTDKGSSPDTWVTERTVQTTVAHPSPNTPSKAFTPSPKGKKCNPCVRYNLFTYVSGRLLNR